MEVKQYPSKLLDSAVNQFSRLPGIGNKTALRLVLFLLKQQAGEIDFFGKTISELTQVKHCKECNNISDSELCEICASPTRDQSLVCVVESIKDVLAIENTSQYKGLYHVLGGIISPMDGIGPNDLSIPLLEKRVAQGEITEIILALSTTMEGDTTNFYIYKKLKDFPVLITTLARGVAIGDELEYTDEVTLGRSLLNRTKFEI